MTTFETENIISEYTNKYTEFVSQRPYSFNILDEQQGRVVENSHTNILIKLLEYNNAHGYEFLQSFCDLAFPSWQYKISGNVVFDTEYSCDGRIDGIIYQKDKFAIIIENKINNAGPQKGQIKRYVQKVITDKNIFTDHSEGINLDKVWVIYLTRNGIGSPEKESIQYLKETFGCEEFDSEIVGERYSALSYANDLYYWIKDVLIPMIPRKEEGLYCGLCQYNNYLSTLLGLDSEEEYLNDKVCEWLNGYFSECSLIEKNQGLLKLYDAVSKKKIGVTENLKALDALQNAALRCNENIIHGLVEATKNFLTRNALIENCKFQFTQSFSYIYFQDGNWPKLVHFEWYPLGIDRLANSKEYTLCLHAETIALRDLFNSSEELKDLLSNLGYKSSDGRRHYEFPSQVSMKFSKPILSMTQQELDTEVANAYAKVITPELISCINKLLG